MWSKLLQVLKDGLQWFYENVILWSLDVLKEVILFLRDLLFWPFEFLFSWILAALPDYNNSFFVQILQIGVWLDNIIPFDAILYACGAMLVFKLFSIVVMLIVWLKTLFWAGA